MAGAAFFDMDRTVLRVNSGTLWMRFLRRRGEISGWQMLRAIGWAAQYKLALHDMESLAERLAAELEGELEQEMVEKCRAWYRNEIVSEIVDPAKHAIDRHRSRGERVVLLTSATAYVAELLGETLAFDGVLCTRLEVQDGRFTGRI